MQASEQRERKSNNRLHKKNDTPICVKLSDDGGILGFRSMTKDYACEAYGIGHYTLVVPISEESTYIKSQIKAAKRKKIKKLENNSENGEPFDTFWIGDTKLPFASMIRTQPVLEND
ncbi:hypothetical protein P8452_69124 [Trifolium repens]|nr:hypothetical protein P8452_69124 [Trifolium repens]